MNLRRIAAKFETTSFDIFDENTQAWTKNGLKGKVMPIDRFLSIFHRATSRRALGVSPNSTLPTSNTIRVPSTGEIYIIGLIRDDQAKSVVYDAVGILSKCYFIGTVIRKVTVGSGEDLGALQSVEVGKHYMDIELRTSSEISGTTEEYEAKFFLTAPLQADIRQWDYIILNSVSYQVTTVYVDSGLRLCRVIEREDPRVDVTLHKKGNTSNYIPSTGQVITGMTDFQVSGFFEGFSINEVDETSILSKDLKFIIDQDHIGIVPNNTDELTYNGQRYKFKGVYRDFLNKQYQIHCRV